MIIGLGVENVKRAAAATLAIPYQIQFVGVIRKMDLASAKMVGKAAVAGLEASPAHQVHTEVKGKKERAKNVL